MQHRNDSQRAALEEFIELRIRHHRQQQLLQQQRQSHAADHNSAVVTANAMGNVNPPMLGPYPYDRQLSAAAAAFNEIISNQAHPKVDQRTLPAALPSQILPTAPSLAPDYALRALLRDGSARVQLPDQQERERIFRIAHGLPPRSALEDDALQRLDSALTVGNLRNIALGQIADSGIMRAHPHFALTTPSSPMASLYHKQSRDLSPLSRQKPRKNLKRSSDAFGVAAQSKHKKRKRSSRSKGNAAASPSTTTSNQAQLEQHPANSGSNFPLPALQDSQSRTVGSHLTSFRQLWNGVKTSGMRQEIFLRRMRLGTISLRSSKSSSLQGTTTSTGGDNSTG